METLLRLCLQDDLGETTKEVKECYGDL